MPISQQMQSIVDSIATFKSALIERAESLEDDAKEILDPSTFCTILSGLPSFRRMPGVPEHMGFDDNYVCDTDEHAQELRDYLESVFGIRDAETLRTQRVEFFHFFNEYYDFACEWDGRPNFALEDLEDEARSNYIASRDFAYYLRDLVGPTGFLAWDVGERIMLIRAAFACGLIGETDAQSMMYEEGRIANSVFDNFLDFAISALCGCVYFMFVSMGRTEDEGLSGFLDINMKIVSKLFEDDIWSFNAWCENNYKQLAIREEQIRQILPESQNDMTGVASDHILCDGFRVGVMVREESVAPTDSGWRFFAGDEDQEYLDSPSNFGVVPLNLIANYAEDIADFLDMPVGTFLARNADGVLSITTPSDFDDPIAQG